MSTPVTPKKDADKVDYAINRLNAKWDLQLPRLHGSNAVRDQDSDQVARRCSARLRYLCFRIENLDGFLNEIDQQLLPLFSAWNFKPSQTPGTLPELPVTKSAIHRDLRSRYGSGPIQLSKDERSKALERVALRINEEYEISRMSDCYERVSGPSNCVSTGTHGKAPAGKNLLDGDDFDTTRQGQSETVIAQAEPSLKYPKGHSSKRSLSSVDVKSKRQHTSATGKTSTSSTSSFDNTNKLIPSYFAPNSSSRTRQPPSTVFSTPLPISFNTDMSPEPSTIFTDAEDGLPTANSNDTSMVSSTGEQESQDLWPTQEWDAVMADEGHRNSINESFDSLLSLPGPSNNMVDVTNLSLHSPFEEESLPIYHDNFLLTYEIRRLTADLSLTHQSLMRILGGRPLSLTPRNLWDKLEKVHQSRRSQPFPARSEIVDWTSSEEENEKLGQKRTLWLSGRLDWGDKPQEQLFKFRLNPTHWEQSCRLHRKYGSDRFLVLSTPIFSHHPFKLNVTAQSLHRRISEWLSNKSHLIAGRYWRVFYVEQDKAKKKGQPGQRLKIHLFAESGCGIASDAVVDFKNLSQSGPREITVQEMMNWHMPFSANLKSTDLKFFSRLSLGLSKTVATVSLEPEEFLYLPDPKSGEVMNDGCALISWEYAKAVWSAYGGTGIPPSVIQGRIGGAKGLWMVDYHNTFPNVSERGFWIQVSDSQLKIHPHPRDWADADPCQRTFEVLKYASETKEAHLNLQLIRILEDRGVPRQVLKDALIADTKTYTDTLAEAMISREALRLWTSEHAPSGHSDRLMGNFPADKQTQINMLLDSGFVPQEHPMIIDGCKSLLATYMSTYVEKLWITIPCSTTVFCAADPLGILAPNEVYLGFSRDIIDPRNELPEGFLNDIDVLVARNPAYLSSDMQKRRAVYKHELRQYQNVILFSTQGDTPLASLLSGGDYDGDRVTVIWDPKFTASFKNAKKPELPSEKECGMVNKSRKLREVFKSGTPHTNDFNDFMRGCIQFNSATSRMGECTVEHEKLVYDLSVKSIQSNLSALGPVKLATLAGYLVDQCKQGWEIENWHKVRGAISGPNALPEPAYKSLDHSRRRNGRWSNIIDYLTFDVALQRKDEVLGHFEKSFPKDKTYDASLSELWRLFKSKIDKQHVAERSSRQSNRSDGSRRPTKVQEPSGLRKLLLESEESLKAQVDTVADQAASIFAMGNPSPAGGSGDRSEFATNIDRILNMWREVRPTEVEHLLRDEHEWQGLHAMSLWSLVRASYLYFKFYSRNRPRSWIWYIAGKELCFLKARQHPCRTVIEPMFNLLKVDAKYTRRRLEMDTILRDDQDEFWDTNEFVGNDVETLEF